MVDRKVGEKRTFEAAFNPPLIDIDTDDWKLSGISVNASTSAEVLENVKLRFELLNQLDIVPLHHRDKSSAILKYLK